MRVGFVPPEPPDGLDPRAAWEHMSRWQRIALLVIVVAGAIAAMFWMAGHKAGTC